MRIAIPVVNKKLSVHFGHAEKFYFFDIENKKIKNNEILNPPVHDVGTIPKWVSQQKATDIIAGGMGQMAIDLFNKAGVNVHIGAQIQDPEKLIVEFLNGTIQLNSNLCDH